MKAKIINISDYRNKAVTPILFDPLFYWRQAVGYWLFLIGGGTK